jgi:hypothetical protein
MVLQIFQFDQFIDGIYVVIDMISSYGSSSFNLSILFLYLILFDGSDKYMCAGINQLVKGGFLTIEEY